jgi:cellulose synthase/poly-beta-1,6-N-acetylglucosamine synthase-like glycosyltransferase
MLLSKEEKNYPEYDVKFSVIIPCYNEDSKYLMETIKSVYDAKGKKEMILVDNNSDKPETLRAIEEIKKQYPEFLILHEKRQGKRFAHSKGLEYAKTDIIVFIDSDTIVDKNAFVEIIKPFRDDNIGAVAGQVKIANRDKNLLTRCISAMFWTSSNIFRKASSSAGYMQVIAGCLSAYRRDLLMKLEEDYLKQTFLGRPCSISDDRYLTQRIQTRFRKKIEYQESAICWTFMPETYIKFWKTIERWRRGVLRETFLIWKEPVKNAKLMFFDMQFNFIVITVAVFLRVFLIYNILTNIFTFNYIGLLINFLVVATMYSSYMVIYNLKEFPYKIIYSFMYEFFFIFTYFHAWLNIRNQGKWSTRAAFVDENELNTN